MLDLPYEVAVERIKAHAGLSDADIESRVQEKLVQLSGLISRDGAVHILANELGVSLTPAPVVAQDLKIADIRLGARSITVKGRVVRKYDVREFDKNGRKGKVASLLIGDETGVTRLVFWNEQVDEVFTTLKDGDVLVVQNPFVKQSYREDRLELQLNTQSTLTVNPEGIMIASRAGGQERAPRVQKYLKDLEGGEENVEVIATIVQVYDPRFYDACGQCRKKLVNGLCPEHGETTADVNFSMGAFLDDGTGNVRTSFWKQQSLVLTGKSDAEFLKFRDDPTSFESVKNELLGEIIKVVGTAKRNATFDRLELTANLVFRDVDPAAELENLEKKFEAGRKEPQQETMTQAPMRKGDDSVLVVEEDVLSLDDLEKLGQ